MLVLSRKKHQVVRIGKDIRLTIVSITEDSVRLGFEAPDNVIILREELREKIVKEGLKSETLKQ